MTDVINPNELTARLLAARRSGLAIAVASADAPATEPEAYLVQRAVAEALGPVGGWKVGAGGPAAPPNAAPLPASVIMTAPARLPSAYSDRLVEAEIAFRMARDLPPRDTPYTRDEVLAAIGSCYPVVEVVQWRIQDHRAASPNLKLADSLGHGALVVGEPMPGWQATDFAGLQVTQEIEGQAPRLGVGNPAGDMIRLIAWLADEGAVWAGGLKAGQIVTCGSWTGMTEAAADAPVVVSFAGFTPLTLSFESH